MRIFQVFPSALRKSIDILQATRRRKVLAIARVKAEQGEALCQHGEVRSDSEGAMSER